MNRDARIGELFGEYVDRLNAGEPVDAARVREEYPDLAGDLLPLLEEFIDAAVLDTAEPSLGTLGDYTLRRQIGRGGMGVVYEAWQNSVDRQVALKVLPAGIAADTNAVTRFIREAKTAANLNHPNVVSVYGMGVESNTPYYTMELVEGDTLTKVLNRLKESSDDAATPFRASRGTLAFYSNVAEVFADVADGLQHAHSKGVIHRDIKPSNLILDEEGQLRILDFGLALHEGQETLTLSGDILGTLLYMSPEQARRRRVPIDHRTDVYSLGATLYELLTRRPPFRGEDHQETITQIIERDPVDPRRINPRTPRDLATIVLKCLRKDPGDRYGTAEALAQDLRRFVRGDPIEARPQTPWDRLTSRVRRHKFKLLVAAGFLVLLVGMGWLEYEKREIEDQRRETEHQARIDAYEPAVLEAVLKIFAGRLTLEAEAGRSEGLIRFRFGGQRPDPLTAEDFQTISEVGRATVEGAVEQLEALVEGLPKRRDAHYQLARAYSLLSRKDKAREALARVLELEPGFVPAEWLEIELSEKSGTEIEEALGALSDKYASSGGWERSWLQARKSEREKKWSEAAAAYGELIRFQQRESQPYIGFSIDVYMAQGLALLETKDYLGAQDAFNSASVVSPEAVEPQLFRAKAYHLAGHRERAASIFQQLFDDSSDAEKAQTALWIATTYNSLWDCQRALDWIKQIEDERLRTRLELYFLFRLGRTEKAIDLGKRIVEGGSPDPIAYYLFALVLFDQLMSRPQSERIERLSYVTQILKRALEIKTDLPPVRKLLELAAGERKRAVTRPNKAPIMAFVPSAALGAVVVGQEGFFDEARVLEGGVNSGYQEVVPVISPNGRELFFGRYNYPGGMGDWDIWVATRSNNDEPFGEATNVATLNTPFHDTVDGLSSDGRTLYFTTDRPGGMGSLDIWVAERPRLDAPFENPRPLEKLNTTDSEPFARVTADGLEIYSSRYSSDAPTDLYVATRKDAGQRFDEPTLLTELNTEKGDYAPFSPDGLTLFFTSNNGWPGQGDADLFVATRAQRIDEAGNRVSFLRPENLGPRINTGIVEFHPYLSSDWPLPGAKLYFSRGMWGQNFDIYEATWHPDCNGNEEDDVEEIADGDAGDVNANDIPDECEPERSAHFRRGDSNADGNVDIIDATCVLSWLLAGRESPGCLAATNANGDGAVDITDATYLLNHLFSGGLAPVDPYPGCGPGMLPVDAELGCGHPPDCQ